MSSPITFSGFNQIDFNVVLNAVMRQESRPLEALQKRREQLEAVGEKYGALTSKLAALKAAAGALSNASTVTSTAAISSVPTAVSVSASDVAAVGRYEVVVNHLATAQVTVTSSTAADANTTTVATGGTLTIAGVAVTISGDTTLSGLAQAINATDGLAVTARVSQTAPGEFRLILTSDESGVANAFTVQNALTGSVAFTGNAVEAQNASLLINNVPVVSTTNTLTSAVEGLTITLLKADPDATVVIDVGRDDADFVERINTFVSAYNELTAFADAELAKAGTFGRDALMRSLRNELRAALSAVHGSGAYTRLAEVGIGFTRTGKLELDEATLREAITANPDAVATLFAHSREGAFGTVAGLVDGYIEVNGHLPDARARLTGEVSRLDARIASMEAILALRRQALQREYAAADAAMTRLNAQSGTLSNLGAALRSANL